MTTLRAPTPDQITLVPPPASRPAGSRWRDPRLAVGLVIVATCVLLGARIVSGADDTVGVWRASHDLPAGSVLTRADLEVARVHAGSDTLAKYFPPSDTAVGNALAHDVAAGELVPRSAVTTTAPALVEVPLSVAPEDVPASVRRGVLVDVWVLPEPGSGARPDRATLALDNVVVVAVPSGGDALAPRTTRHVIVGVSPEAGDDLAHALGVLAQGRLLLTRQAGS